MPLRESLTASATDGAREGTDHPIVALVPLRTCARHRLNIVWILAAWQLLNRSGPQTP